jgi:hypothetical protein
MPIPNWLPALLWYLYIAIFWWLGVPLACYAFALSLGQERYRRRARIVRPLAVLTIWTGGWLFLGWAAATDPDNYIYGMGLERLRGPAAMIFIGAVVCSWWFCEAVRLHRRDARAGGGDATCAVVGGSAKGRI